MSVLNKISVVMPTYAADSPLHLLVAGQSVLRQTFPPDELIIVLDGPVKQEAVNLMKSLTQYGTVRIIPCEINMGPGIARHIGIMSAKNEIIALMDADDISLPSRFQLQIEAMISQSVDVVGGWIREFDADGKAEENLRIVPEFNNQILKLAKVRSPMNNVTVMFKRDLYLKSGGFSSMRSFEDYDLYVRMLLVGARFYNLQEVLVQVRSGVDMFRRRGGLKQIPIESGMLLRMYKSGFLSAHELIRNWIMRTAVRLLPNRARRFLYLTILRR